jgi:hypothetical protein
LSADQRSETDVLEVDVYGMGQWSERGAQRNVALDKGEIGSSEKRKFMMEVGKMGWRWWRNGDGRARYV